MGEIMCTSDPERGEASDLDAYLTPPTCSTATNHHSTTPWLALAMMDYVFAGSLRVKNGSRAALNPENRF